jgi:hypothetical protein
MEFEEELNEFMNHLIESGAMILHGMTENGEVTYKFDFDVLRQVSPEFYDLMMEDINESVLELYKDGYVDMEYDEELKAKFKVNEKGEEFLNKMKEQDNLFWEW